MPTSIIVRSKLRSIKRNARKNKKVVKKTIKRVVKLQVRRAPDWNVFVYNSDRHSVEYVVRMLMNECGKTYDEAMKMAGVIHMEGKAVVWTGNKQEAERLVQSISNLGPDPLAQMFGIKGKGGLKVIMESVE